MKRISLLVCLLMSLMLINCTEEVAIVGSPNGSSQVADSSEDDATDDTADDSTGEDDDSTDDDTTGGGVSTDDVCYVCDAFSQSSPNPSDLTEMITIDIPETEYCYKDLDGLTFAEFESLIENFQSSTTCTKQ